MLVVTAGPPTEASVPDPAAACLRFHVYREIGDLGDMRGISMLVKSHRALAENCGLWLL
jgi:hypothetical protein